MYVPGNEKRYKPLADYLGCLPEVLTGILIHEFARQTFLWGEFPHSGLQTENLAWYFAEWLRNNMDRLTSDRLQVLSNFFTQFSFPCQVIKGHFLMKLRRKERKLMHLYVREDTECKCILESCCKHHFSKERGRIYTLYERT